MNSNNIINELLARFKKTRIPTAIEASSLGKLPAETLLQIRDYLPYPSASSFSICCKQINQLIGNSPLYTRQDILEVGELLARDLPDKVACSVCMVFHDLKNAKKHITCSYTSESAACVAASRRFSDTTESWFMMGGHFSAVVFKMAMKLYKHHPADLRILSLMSPRAEIGPRIRYCRLCKTDCRIVQATLMQRVQEIFISRRSTDLSK